MPDAGDLERAYQRLLRAYPRFYRRERGLEMLTTLLDAAAPGQTRPSRDEAVWILLTGLRLRLVPPGWAGKLVTVLVTMWTALVLGGAGAYAAWSAAPPAGTDVAALSDALVAKTPSSTHTTGDGNLLGLAYGYQAEGEFQQLGAEGWDGPMPAPVGRTRVYPAGDPAVLARAHRALADAGWQTGTIVGGDTFWAHHDGMLLRMSGGYEHVTVNAYPAEPGGVRAAAIAGAAFGVLAAWPFMTWLTHRIARTPGVSRWTLVLLVPQVALICAVNTVDSVLSMWPDPDTAAVPLAVDWIYPLANQAANPLAAIMLAFTLAVAVGLITAGDRRRPANAAPSTRPARN
ncbi:hypothetical protein AB0G04_06130 [Actinoplanes sp. NPDC023801]|uniref:hypothetical protein n=1 Tax=Actinoplanes sp. NPDC023801 TaxID=3154595 RepID=UPI0034087480